jgi:hypothetical protein
MASQHFPVNGSTHLRQRFRFPAGPQAAGNLFELGSGKMGRGAE